MSKIKNKELFVNMSLQFLVMFIKNTSTETSADAVNLQKRAISVLLQLRKHPNDEVLMNLLSMLKILFSSPQDMDDNEQSSNKMDVLNHVNLPREVFTHLIKDFLMFAFAIIKKKFLAVELCGDVLKDCLCGFLMKFSNNTNFFKKLLQMITEGLKQIIIKSCKKVTSEAPIIEKVILVLEGIINMFAENQPKLFLDQEKLNREHDEDWMAPVFNILAKLRENGNVKAIDYLYNKLEILIENTQEVTDERYFVKELAKNVKEVTEAKAEVRSKHNEYAITNPQAYNKEKLKKALRARQRKKEKIRTYKFGTAQTKYTTGENHDVKKKVKSK